MNVYESERPLYALTEGEHYKMMRDLINEALENHFKVNAPAPEPPKTGRLVYGIVGLERALGVSHKTAQKLKDGVLKPAVKQRGRKIITDLDLALQLFDENKGRK